MAKSIYSKRHQRLCELLIEARKEAELTQQDVADSLGKPQSYVAKIEGGERRLDVVEFLGFCEEIGADSVAILTSLKKVN